MDRKYFGPFTGGQLTVIIGLAIIAPSAVYGAATFTSVALQDASSGVYAYVDSAGRLATRSDPALSTIVRASIFANVGYTNITSPTTAQLAVSQLKISETRYNGVTAGADLTVYLVQLDASGGTCSTSVMRYLAVTTLQSGQQLDVLSGSAPVVVAPISGAQYCLGIFSSTTNGAADATAYYPYYTLTAYAARGKYTGTGVGSAAEAAPALMKKGQ